MAVAESIPELEETTVRADLLNLLVVDDERAVRDGCRDVAQGLGFSTFSAENAEHAFKVLDSQNIDVVLLDLKLPGASGLEILKQVRERKPEAAVIVITGYATVQSAVQAMKMGAYDYVTKPFNVEELRLLLERVASHMKLTCENRLLREKIKSKQGFAGLIGHAPEMEKLYRLIAKVSRSNHPVLIQGESGTGKELVARAIHFSGPFREHPFLPVDCGSLVPTLIESELFGYVRGAFTGAVRSKDGLLAMADGGTVFLDEIGELPVDLQSKLLRALQEKEIRPVGSTQRVPINVRILAATNRDLQSAVEQGTFRKDLFFRLNVVTLTIPPLRERKQDVPLLASHILERLTQGSGIERSISDEALKLMLAYDWPGNVRELENCLERASSLSSGPIIQAADLPTAIQNAQNRPSAGGVGGSRIIPIAELEKQAILGTIDQLHGDKLMAARLLGIGKTTLYRKLKEYSSQD
jgi:two-component system response regulator HydG